MIKGTNVLVGNASDFNCMDHRRLPNEMAKLRSEPVEQIDKIQRQ